MMLILVLSNHGTARSRFQCYLSSRVADHPHHHPGHDQMANHTCHYFLNWIDCHSVGMF